MAAAEKRVEDLLDRWMASLELHAKYLALDDAAYARAEAWPKHQRPTRWVVDLARQRLLELRAQLTQRKDAGDAAFADALELMSFLTSLLGSEHIDRFIPLATGKRPDTASVSGTVEQPRLRASKPKAASGGTSGTHKQMPAARPPSTAKPGAPAQRPAAARSAASRPAAAAVKVQAPPRPAAAPVAAAAPATDAKSLQVIADAVRMLEWGREWPALAGLIARMADRPPETEVWKILRAHRTAIMAKAHRPAN